MARSLSRMMARTAAATSERGTLLAASGALINSGRPSCLYASYKCYRAS